MTACTVRHSFDLALCGRPAIFAIAGTDARVCRECRRYLHHMPAHLFMPLLSGST